MGDYNLRAHKVRPYRESCAYSRGELRSPESREGVGNGALCVKNMLVGGGVLDAPHIGRFVNRSRA